MKKEEESMTSRRLQRFRAEETHKCIAMKYSTTAHSRWVVIVGLYVSQQSINIADSPKDAFVQITLADPLSRYLRGMCVGCTILSWSVPDDTSATKNQRKRERSDRKRRSAHFTPQQSRLQDSCIL